MQWCLRIGVCVMVLAMACPAMAADIADQKFGYVDLQRALNEVKEGKTAKAELQRTYKARQRELEKLQKSLESMKKTLEKDRLVLSADALRKKEENYRAKFLELTQKMKAFEMELAQKEQETTGAILNALRRVVQKIGDEEKYEMILEISQDVRALFATQCRPDRPGDFSVQ